MELRIDETQTSYVASEPFARPFVATDDLLPPSEGSFDPLTLLEELLVRMKIEDRQHARQENLIEEARVQRAGQAQVAAIHEKADSMWAQGLINGLGQIGGGMLTAHGGFAGFSAADTSRGMAIDHGFGGLGKAVEGAGTLGGTAFGVQVEQADARRVNWETRKESAERRASQAAADEQGANDDLRALFSALQKIHEAELAASSAAVFSV
jgi:hypothetical protein